ncbi:MAG: hypothetical protein Q9O74_01650 [Planctomycetota bacterium]|nr:hypothetical protein [Planctomycetota bacterium]
MTSFGPNLAASIAGAPAAERQRVQRSALEARAHARARETRRDERDAPVDQVELTEAVRNLKDNSQEETQDDRKQHADGSKRRRAAPDSERHQIDLEG